MNKRGQLTIFIIIAILIVAGIVLFFSLKGTFQKGEVYAPEVEPIVNFVDECLEGALEEGIYSNGLQGGYYQFPNEPLPILYEGNVIPFYIIEDQSFLPSLEFFENQIGLYIKTKLSNCILDFNSTSILNISWNSNFDIDVDISDKIVGLNMNYPIAKVTFGESVTSFSKRTYEDSLDFDYIKVYTFLEDIVDKLSGKDTFPMSFFASLAEENGFTFGFVDLGESQIIIYLDFEGDTTTPNYFHTFAFKTSEEISEAFIRDIPLQTAKIGELFNYDVGEVLPPGFTFFNFADTSSLFDISPNTGQISFIPSSENIGINPAVITFFDSKNKEYQLFIEIEVKE